MQELVGLHTLNRVKLVVSRRSALLLDQIANFRPVAEHQAQSAQALHLQQVGGGLRAVVPADGGIWQVAQRIVDHSPVTALCHYPKA